MCDKSSSGVVTVYKNGSPIYKVFCLCNGYQAEAAADRLEEEECTDVDDAYHIAETAGMGCGDCLAVVGDDYHCYYGINDLPESYRESLWDEYAHPGLKDEAPDHTHRVEL